MTRSKRIWLTAGLLILLALAAELGRRILFGHLLYTINLRERARLNHLAPPAAGSKVLLFAPHEDDETLGCGGYLQRAVDAGAQVGLVLMTNGEYPELSVLLFEETLRTAPAEFIKLGYLRQKETLAAVEYLGLPGSAVTFLGYPNQYLNQMWLPEHWLPDFPVESRRTRATRSPYDNSLTPGAIYCGQSALQDVEAVLLREKPDIVITVHSNDIHVDHWPTGAFVRYALEELAARGEAFARHCQVYTYLIHRDHWPVPRLYKPLLTLEPPESLVRMAETTWFALPISLVQTTRKYHAIGLYRTQGGSYDPLLRSFARANDLFGVEPIREWPRQRDVPEETVIRDPLVDLDTANAHPAGNIRQVTLARKGARLIAAITTRTPPTREITYHLSLHAGRAGVAERMIAQYNWQYGMPDGFLLQNNQIRPFEAGELAVSTAEERSILEAPWPIPDAAGFFLIRAWTTRGKEIVDQTATTLFRMAGGSQE